MNFCSSMDSFDENLLMLSGIQHFAYCPRQWALIHIEQQWIDNHFTIEGKYLHNRVDNPECRDPVRKTITLRSVSLVNRHLGIYGIADVVEMHPENDGIIYNPQNETSRIPKRNVRKERSPCRCMGFLV